MKKIVCLILLVCAAHAQSFDCALSKVDSGVTIFYDNPIFFESIQNSEQDIVSIKAVLTKISDYEIHFKSICDFSKLYAATPDIIEELQYTLLTGPDYTGKNIDLNLIKAWKAITENDAVQALQSIADFSTLISGQPDNPWPYMILSLLYSSYENLALIEPDKNGNIYYKALEKAMMTPDQTALVCYFTAECFKYIGYTNPSAHKITYLQYQKAEALAPDNKRLKEKTLSTIAEFYQLYDYYDSELPFWITEALYKKMIELNQKDSEAYNNLGYAYLNQKETTKEQLETALNLCSKACELEPDNPDYLDSKAWALYINGKTDESISLYTELLKKHPDHYQSLSHLSSIYLDSGDDKKTLEILKKILELKPDDTNALNNTGYIFAEQGENLEYALSCCEKAIHAEPDNDIFLDSIAWVHYKLKNYDKAYEYQKKAADINPSQVVYHKHLAEILFCLSRFDECEAELLKSLALRPNDEESLLRISALRAVMFFKFAQSGQKVESKYSEDIFVTEMLKFFQRESSK